MNSEVAWLLVSSGTPVQPQIILYPDYLPDYLSGSYDYEKTEELMSLWSKENCLWDVRDKKYSNRIKKYKSYQQLRNHRYIFLSFL